jgi:helicase
VVDNRTYLTIKGLLAPESETYRACFDMLGRPRTLTSPTGKALLKALRDGDMGGLADMAHAVSDAASAALGVGPSEWIPARLLDQIMGRFIQTNVRAVLPDGASPAWNPLIASFLDRTPPSWEFFPSQIQAIQSGLLERRDTFSLQMPTGAGKTALCETLLYWHSLQNPGQAAVLLVPYRSLASELRSTVVKRLNAMGISARCAYGGTVPTGDEVRGLDETRVIVATPEALSGLLSADAAFMRRISLMICDEGHLLDSGARGVGLEL